MSKTMYLHLEPHWVFVSFLSMVLFTATIEHVEVLCTCIATTSKTYNDLGVEVKELK